MPKLPPMIKHRGFPSRLPGTDFQFTIRRAAPIPVRLERKERHGDRKKILQEADANFLACIWDHFGAEPFERGNLDAGRLNALFMREIIPAQDPFDPADYEALLMVDEAAARISFPQVFDR